MKAQDLMIGDWVFAVDCARPNAYRVTKVNAQPENGEYPIHIDRPADGLPYTFLDFDQVAPIPLTAEILEKNGWEKSSITDYKWSALYEGNRLPDMWEDTNKQYLVTIGLIDVNINYVHELQHALRLCGIEKEIVL